MNKKECIIHYEGQRSYSKLKCLSETNINRINEAKKKRQEIGGVHCPPQVGHVPDDIDHVKHGVHLNPCYMRYLPFFL